MSKRTVFTTISPLPGGISREFVIDFLHNHVGMIDLNPLVKERHPIKPPPGAPADEAHCVWYSLTDRITYLPGGLASGDISYTCAFHDIPNGIQTHCRAPLNVDIREKWTLNGTLPGEAPEPVELGIGAPATGLYIREDVDLRCNFLMAGFVKKNLTKAHAKLVDRLVEKAKLVAAREKSVRASKSPSGSVHEQPQQPSQARPLAPASTPAPTLTAANGIRRKSAQRAKSPPPQLGSPFIAGYQPVREPSLRVPNPNKARKSLDSSADPTHHKSHSQDSFKVRLQAYDGDSVEAPPPLRLGHQSQPRPQHHSLPPHYDSTLYPQPLRLRNSSAGSGMSSASPMPGAAGAHAIPFPGLSSSSTTPTAHTMSEPRRSSSSSDHPEYPQLNPYSGAGSSLDESLPPRTPQFIAELTAGDDDDGGLPVISDGDYPAALRAGGAGTGARPKSPFISELE
ncbi:hypothetical protein VMCG_05292 [Cytospora schulzeri]|uniref:DUF7053 domain-containing protein n=1 Tax=Cytospora schulzeri TaxID=448051 RepID=A0A423WQT6_9PEZI|nr:hypothetical protein VMCG_05292 [Valsa malicola]